MVLGRDLLIQIGLVLDYKTEVFKWGKVSMAMKPPGNWTESKILTNKKENLSVIEDDQKKVFEYGELKKELENQISELKKSNVMLSSQLDSEKAKTNEMAIELRHYKHQMESIKSE